MDYKSIHIVIHINVLYGQLRNKIILSVNSIFNLIINVLFK